MPCTCTDIRTEARFDLEPFTPIDLDEVKAAVLAETDVRHKAEGWRRCRDCGFRPHPEDMDWLQRRKCTSCAMRQID
jgi:hypothetical protein